MIDNPWADLPRARSRSELSARRVDDDIAANFFWARDTDGHCLLLLEHSVEFPESVRLPRLRGLTIVHAELDSGAKHLRFTLQDSDLRDIFAELCSDIVRAAAGADSETAVIRAAVSRTWRWHHLLKGGAGHLLSEQQQKGLIGELVLMEAMAERVRMAEVVDAWRGPLGEPKDFVLPGSIAVESKAVRVAEAPFVQISSEWQLDNEHLKKLYLSVVEVTRSVESKTGSLTLTIIVDQVRQLVLDRSPGALFEFEARLFATGYRPEDDYGEYWWDVNGFRFYEIGATFPRIPGSELPPGIQHVTYQILLTGCGSFALDRVEFLNRLSNDAAQ